MTLLIPENDTLVTYYMLPLVDVNKRSFGRSFKTSYISKDAKHIFVELKKPMVSPSYAISKYYVIELEICGVLFVQFNISAWWRDDAQLFIKGEYSKMSKDAKHTIYKSSTLPFNKTVEDFKMSHPILQALGKTKTLRRHLTEMLNVETLADSDELIEVPDESWFIEHRVAELKATNFLKL